MSYQSVPASGGGLPATTLAGYFLRDDSTWQPIAGGGDALVANPLSQFASTTSAQFAGVISNKTGTGVVVFATSPTLVTPVLGVATVTTVNKVTITAPATSATLTIADGATLTASATATVSGTNTGDQTLSDATISTSDITTNNFTTAKHGFVPKGTNVGSFLKDDGTWAAIPGGGDALTSNPLSQFATTTPTQLAGVLAGGVTGTGNFVQATSPTLVTPALGVATVTSVNKVAITAPATSATLVIADGVTLTCSASVDTNNLAPKASPTFTGTVTTAAIATANNNITGAKQVTFNGVVAGGNKTGAAPNLADWTSGSLQTITLTGNVTGAPTFTAPTGVSRLTLIVVQDGTGSRTMTWPSAVKWAGGVAPTLTTTATTGTDIFTFIYDGTTYWGAAALNFG